MMFAEPEDVEPHLIGKLDLLDQMLQPFGPFRTLAAGGIGIDIRKRIKTQFHRRHPVEFRQEIRIAETERKYKLWNGMFENFDSGVMFSAAW